MQYDFLKNFPKRMKNVGLYAVLVRNITSKTTWNNYGITKDDDQINIVFSVMLFLMENSLKEEPCTIDDITVFVDSIAPDYPCGSLGFDECRELASFIINSILTNEGVPMSFDGFDYENRSVVSSDIRYVTNHVVYLDSDVKRTSYHLTDDGYSLLLSTLEIESNMRLSVQELLFQMHLEKQSYDRAVDDIKEIFNQMRIQIQRVHEAMTRIRRNALDYSVAEYELLRHQSLDSLSDTRSRFEAFRELVDRRRKEVEDIRINVRELNDDERRNLSDLGIIASYLDRVLEEHQKIISSNLELKDLYTRELENLSRVASIRRFSLRDEVYDSIIRDPSGLGNLGGFLTPLFRKDPDKIYDPLRAASLQRPFHNRKENDAPEDIWFDEEQWEAERERLLVEKRRKYESCLAYILEKTVKEGNIRLSDIRRGADAEGLGRLIPEIDVFKEVMVELIKSRVLDLPALRKERSASFSDTEDISTNAILLDLLDKMEDGRKIRRIFVARCGEDTVVFDGIPSGDGCSKAIRCSDVEIRVE